MAFSVTSPERCWIKYQLSLKQAKLEDVARKAGCNITMVSQVLHGRKNSERVRQALADVLGFSSFDKLISAYQKEVTAA
jgi:transcriptional regulator with XRE-family HTH domain